MAQTNRALAERTEKVHNRWFLAVAALILVGAIALLVPAAIYPPLNAVQIDQLGIQHRLKAQNDRSKLQNDLRTTLLQGLGGLAVLIGAYAAFRQLRASEEQTRTSREFGIKQFEHAQNQLAATQEWRVAERFSHAIDQLGSNELDVRLGGIYSLEHIARDSSSDQCTIEEILTAFVREHSPWPPRQTERSPAEAKAGESVLWLPNQSRGNEGDDEPEPQVRADVQAAISVLGRRQFRKFRPKARQLDLRKVDLRSCELSEALLRWAMLSEAHLEKARLLYAHLEWAVLGGAHLEEAWLLGAHLENSLLKKAHLSKAKLGKAFLEKADLRGANLKDAKLENAKLDGARHDNTTVWPEGFDWKAATGTEPEQPFDSP
jgi:hypothetical protein